MGKKKDSIKKAEKAEKEKLEQALVSDEKPAKKKKEKAKAKAAEVPVTVAAEVEAPAVKPAKPAKRPAAPRAKKSPAKSATGNGAVPISQEDIALRAYFIAEKRQREGLPGDSSQDWIEAERQLKAESLAPKATA